MDGDSMIPYEKTQQCYNNPEYQTGRLFDKIKTPLLNGESWDVDFPDSTYDIITAWSFDGETYLKPRDHYDIVFKWLIDNAYHIGRSVDYVKLGRMLPYDWLNEMTRVYESDFISVYCYDDLDYALAWVIEDLIIGNYSDDDYKKLAEQLNLI